MPTMKQFRNECRRVYNSFTTTNLREVWHIEDNKIEDQYRDLLCGFHDNGKVGPVDEIYELVRDCFEILSYIMTDNDNIADGIASDDFNEELHEDINSYIANLSTNKLDTFCIEIPDVKDAIDREYRHNSSEYKELSHIYIWVLYEYMTTTCRTIAEYVADIVDNDKDDEGDDDDTHKDDISIAQTPMNKGQ